MGALKKSVVVAFLAGSNIFGLAWGEDERSRGGLNERLGMFMEAEVYSSMSSPTPTTTLCGCDWVLSPGGSLALSGLCAVESSDHEVLKRSITWGRVQNFIPAIRALGCDDHADCMENHAEYRNAWHDPHNIAPFVSDAYLAYSEGYFLDNAPRELFFPNKRMAGISASSGACAFNAHSSAGAAHESFMVRAKIYMQARYPTLFPKDDFGLAIRDLRASNLTNADIDPPQAWEKERNRRIAQYTGIENPFISQHGGSISYEVFSELGESAFPVVGLAGSREYLTPFGCESYKAHLEGRGQRMELFESEQEAQESGYERAEECDELRG